MYVPGRSKAKRPKTQQSYANPKPWYGSVVPAIGSNTKRGALPGSEVILIFRTGTLVDTRQAAGALPGKLHCFTPKATLEPKQRATSHWTVNVEEKQEEQERLGATAARGFERSFWGKAVELPR